MNVGGLISVRRWLKSAWVIAVLSQGAAFAEESAVVEFDIDAQELGDALTEFGVQSGTEVYFVSADVAGVQAPRIEGKYSAIDVIHRLLVSSGVEYLIDGNGTLLVGTAYTAVNTSDERGASDSKNLTPQPVLMAQNQTEESQPRNTNAMDVALAEDEEPRLILDEIIVTGTNIRGAQSPTTQVLQFDRADIDLSGAATVEDFLRTVPQNFSSATLATSNTSNFETGNAGFPEQVINLRGAGAGATLTLLNGRRLVGSGGFSYVDISAIPLSVVDRVDILTDGASAIYGSDAVAGVVNFITRTSLDGIELRGRYGAVTQGGHDQYQIGATAGKTWNGGGAFANVEYSETSPLLARDRDFIDPSNLIAPDASLLPDEDRLSIAASLNHSVTENLSFNSDFIFTSRDVFTNDVFFGQRTDETESFFVSSKLTYEINDELSIQIFGDYGEAESASGLVGFDTSSMTENQLTTVEGLLSGKLLSLAGGDVSFALGGQYREEQLESLSIDGAKRNIWAGYGELLLPIVGEGNTLPLVQGFSISVAARFEDYSDFGDTFNPRIGVHWILTDELEFKANYAKAFRAPELGRLFANPRIDIRTRPSSFLSVAPSPTQDPRLPVDTISVLTTLGGNPDLTEETGTSWTLGLTYQPRWAEGLVLSAGFFDVSYSDRIEFVRIDSIFQDPSFISLLELPPNSDRVEALLNDPSIQVRNLLPFEPVVGSDIQVIANTGFQNVARRDIRSLDFQADFSKDTDYGVFNAALNATYMLKYYAQIGEGAPTSEQVDRLFFPVDLIMRGNISLSKDGLTAFAAVNYTAPYQDNLGEKIDSFTTVDLTLAYDSSERFGNALLDNTRISFSVQNLFAADPPFVTTFDSFNFDAANASGLGRFLSVNVTKTF